MSKGKKVKTGKKPHKNKATSKKYTKYKIEGDKLIKIDRSLRLAREILRHQIVSRKKKTLAAMEKVSLSEKNSSHLIFLAAL